MRSKRVKVSKERYEFGSCFRTLAVILVSDVCFFQKKVSRSMPPTSQTQRFWADGVLESGTSVSATGRQFGVSTRQTVSDLATPQWAPPSADRSAGSLRHCHTPVEQTSSSNAHCWQHRRTENTFCCCPEPFEWARPTRKAPCWSAHVLATHVLNLTISKWPRAEGTGGGNHSWQGYFLWFTSTFKRWNQISSQIPSHTVKRKKKNKNCTW